MSEQRQERADEDWKPVSSPLVSPPNVIGQGLSTIVRIPIPGMPGMAVELRPRNFKGSSTSVLFFQDVSGKRVLRLDYGYNKTTGQVDVHWNQKGVHGLFRIQNHAPLDLDPEEAKALYRSFQVYRFVGRVFLVIAVATDAYRIVTARDVPREIVSTVSGWAAAREGCKRGGALAARVQVPNAWIKGGLALGGCVIGGGAGYFLGYEVSQTVYDTVWQVLHPTGEDPAAVVEER